MPALLREYLQDVTATGIILQLANVAGFLLALLLIARLMREKRAPANTFAWLLVIVFLPWLGVPLYLLIGSRKLERITRRKRPLHPTLPPGMPAAPRGPLGPTAQALVAAGAPEPLAGNRLQLLTTGEEAYAALEDAIRGARTHIHIATFILGRDDTGRRLVRLLAERAREGVKVRLLVDALGSFLSGGAFLRPLREAGGEVGRFMPVLPFTSRGSANLRNHRKIAVFDHATAMVGGHNLAREYLGPTRYARRYADFGAVIEGPAAALVDEVFLADWCFATRQDESLARRGLPPAAAPSAGDPADLQVVASGPDVPGDPLYEGIVSMIQEAERSIWIVTPYFIPDEVLLRSLIVKARAGREVTLITPRRSDHPVADFARRHYLRELQRAGGRVRFWAPGMLHAKAIIVDERIGLLGSANFDLRSLLVNFEIGLLVHSPAEVARMQAWAQSVADRCQPPKPARPGRFRLASHLAEDLSRLLAPLL